MHICLSLPFFSFSVFSYFPDYNCRLSRQVRVHLVRSGREKGLHLSRAREQREGEANTKYHSLNFPMSLF